MYALEDIVLNGMSDTRVILSLFDPIQRGEAQNIWKISTWFSSHGWECVRIEADQYRRLLPNPTAWPIWFEAYLSPSEQFSLSKSTIQCAENDSILPCTWL